MKNLFNFVGAFVILLSSVSLNAQVTGTVNVPGTYATLELAVTALNTQGVGVGGAVINVNAPQTAPVNGYQLGSPTLNASLTSSNTLTFNGNGNTITGYAGTRVGSLTSGINDGIFILSGPDHVTFNNIVFEDPASNNTSTLAMEHAIGLYNATATVGSADGCRFISVTNCVFNMGNFASTGAVIAAVQYVWNVATAVAWDGSSLVDIHSDLLVDNNSFSSFYNGVHFRGAPSRSARKLIVTNNTFTGVGGGSVIAYGVFTLYLDSIIYNNNTSIGDLAQTTTSHHVQISTNSGGFMQLNNNDLTLTSGTTTALTAGMTVASIGIGREMNNNRIRFGSFPSITSATIDGLRANYSGGNIDITFAMDGNVIMDETLPPTTGTITLLFNGASNGSGRIVRISNSIITNLTKNNSGTINCIQPGTANVVYVNNNTVSNITITNNSASGITTLRGIYAFGVPPTQFIHNNTVTNFTVSGTSTSTTSILRGIEANTTSTAFSNNFDNSISNLSFGMGTLTGTVAGIYHSANSQNTYRNNISNLSARQAAGLVYGILTISGPTVNIYNNFITGLSAPEANSNIAIAGLHFTSTTVSQVNILHNTIYPSSAAPLVSSGALFGAAGIQTSNSANPIFRIKNNIINITGTANGDAYIAAIKTQLAGTSGVKPATIMPSNNIYNAPYIFGQGVVLSTATNVYYISGGTVGTADPNFNTACGVYKTFMQDIGTASENNLVSLGGGLFAPTGLSFAESSATTNTTPSVTDDFNSMSRGVFPDMGALEFNGTGIDITGPQINYTDLPNTICTNSVQLTAEIFDPTGVNVTTAKPRLYFKRTTHNNVLPPTNTNLSNGWKFVEATNSSSPFTFDINFSILFGAPPVAGWEIEYFVVAQDENALPNVGANSAVFPVGFCPSSTNLTTSAFPVAGVKSFTILAAPTMVTTLSNSDTLCVSGDIILSLGGDPSSGAQYQWQSSPKGLNVWTNIAGANAPTLDVEGLSVSTDYRCIISCGGTPISASPSTPIAIEVLNPEILSTQGAVSCTSPASLILTATAGPGTFVDWYENPSGGLPIFTGTSFTTPLLNTTTTYYVAGSNGGSTIYTGLPNALPTAISGAGTTAFGIVFNAFAPFVLKSVVIYPIATIANSSGTVTIDVIDANNNILHTKTVNVIGNPVAMAVGQRVDLDFNIQPGTNLKLRPGARSSSISGLLFEPSASAPGGNYGFPYTIPGVVSLLYSTLTAAPTNTPRLDLYYYFYDWEIVTGCSTERIPVTASIVVDPPTCPDDMQVCAEGDGIILEGALPVGGTYSGTNVVDGVFLPSPPPGPQVITYTICGLSCTFNINVTQNNPIISITENSGATANDGMVCAGDMATLTAPLNMSYSWSNGETTQSIIVGVGNYSVTVTDDNGCIGSSGVTISTENPPTIVPSIVQPTTCISNDGSINLDITSPGTFTYAWNNGGSTNSINNLSVGEYIVTITNTTTGCEFINVYSLDGPGGCGTCPEIPNLTIEPSPACVGVNFTASSTSLTNMGVTYGIQFKYFTAATANPYVGGTVLGTVSNGDLTNTKTIATLAANIPTSGTYFVYSILTPTPLTDACRPFGTTTLVVAPLPTANIAVTDNSGNAPNDGIICAGSSATLTASGGGTYLWSTGATTAAITVNTAGIYTVTVTSGSGCIASTSRTIVVNPLPTVSVAITENSGTTNNDGNICMGATAMLTAIGTGTYLWSSGQTTQSIMVNASGTYTVSLTNTNGCTNTASANITVFPLPTAEITPLNPSIIEGDQITLTATGGGTYLWNTGSTAPSITVAPIVNTNYSVVVTSVNGCKSTASTSVTVLPPPCSLVCSGDQDITLTPGSCEYLLPNLVTFAGRCNVYRIVQTSGPTPGTLLGKGSYTLTYELRRISTGEVFDSCEFTVNVNGFSNPVGSLACNNHINLSIDPNCQVILNADMFLEGGPYSCYWDYQINIWPFQSEVNAINNVPQGVGLNLPFGIHTYEIVGADGNKCWGTFTVEDKAPPVISCQCEDDPTILPITTVTGSFDFDSPKLEVSTIASACTKTTTANRQMPYAVIIPFSVTAPGFINFTINATLNTNFPFSVNSNFGYQYIYSKEPNPNDLCDGYVHALGFTTNGNYTPTAVNLAPIGGQFVPGVTYYYVYASAYLNNIMNYTINFTHNGGGQILSIQNPANAPECQFACYDLEVVKRETLPMLLNPVATQNKSRLTSPPTFSDCGPVTARFVDKIEPDGCGKTKLRRTWTVEDQNGYKSSCTQTFTFNPLNFASITPPAQEVTLTCGVNTSPANISALLDIDSRSGNPSAVNIGAFADDYAQTSAVEEFNEGHPFGYFTYQQIGFNGGFHAQKVDADICNLYTTYTDDMFPTCGLGCGGNMKVLRTWKVLDWCTKQTVQYTQLIKAVDTKAPTFDVKEYVVSVDPWLCEADWSVDRPWELQDNCAKPEEIRWGIIPPAGIDVTGTQPNYVMRGLTKGTHEFTYWAEDCCGNYTEKTSTITVIDAAGPIVILKQNIVLSLTSSGTAPDGTAKLYGFQVDNGSYDNCSPVGIEIRRLSGGACENIGSNNHNNNSTYNDNNGYFSENPGSVWFHPMDNANDTDGGEFVKFCCDDIPAGEQFGLHDIEIRVWDDGNMNGLIGDNDIIDGLKDNYNTSWATIRVENKLAPKLVCPDDVTVTCDMDINLSIGLVTDVANVNLSMTGYPKAFDLCTNLEITYTDQWIGQFNDVCKIGTIRRTFTTRKGNLIVTCPQLIKIEGISVPNSVTFAQNNGTTEWNSCDLTLENVRNVNNPLIKRPIVNFGPCDVVGENITIDTFLIEDGACKKWKVTYEYFNWCTGTPITLATGAPMVHYYAYKDDIAPIITCNDQMFAANPNPLNPQGGCEASVVLTASATDAIVCADESWVKWQMFADLWANGTVDRVASSFVNRAWNGVWVAIPRLVNSAVNPAWTALQNQHPGVILDDLVYATYLRPTAASGGTVSTPSFILPAENINHKVIWKVTDGCGNHDNCENTLMVVDKKPPTPYCVSISTALMRGNPKMVELWAVDFNQGSFDNCTPQNKLYYTFEGVAPIFSRINEEHFFKAGQSGSLNATNAEYLSGRAYKWLPNARSAGKVFSQAGVISLDVSVWDEAWNTDFCTVSLTINDNANSLLVAGKVATVDNRGILDVEVTGYANLPEFPKSEMTNLAGDYLMVIEDDTELVARKDGDDINGVSTLDLVLIQRHILGVTPLDSPYKLIAADANNDNRVSASDLSDIRRLILGIISEYPRNQSWRFPVKGAYMNPTSPFPFVEKVMAEKDRLLDEYDFIGVKIGDVNNSAEVNALPGTIEPRTVRKFELMSKAESDENSKFVEMQILAASGVSISGLQMTLETLGGKIKDVKPGSFELTSENFNIVDENKIAFSFASDKTINISEDEVLFTIVLEKGSSQVNNMHTLFLTSNVTRSEYYDSDLNVGEITLRHFSNSSNEFIVHQNEPNPFTSQTNIVFEVPNDDAYDLKVFDASGKVLLSRKIKAIKGVNVERISRNDLNVGSGILMYTIENNTFSGSRRMILVD